MDPVWYTTVPLMALAVGMFGLMFYRATYTFRQCDICDKWGHDYKMCPNSGGG